MTFCCCSNNKLRPQGTETPGEIVIDLSINMATKSKMRSMLLSEICSEFDVTANTEAYLKHTHNGRSKTWLETS